MTEVNKINKILMNVKILIKIMVTILTFKRRISVINIRNLSCFQISIFINFQIEISQAKVIKKKPAALKKPITKKPAATSGKYLF